MKQKKEFLDHVMQKHQERRDRDHLQTEKTFILEFLLEEEPNGSTMGEERQAQIRRLIENTNDKEAWFSEEKEENLTVNFAQLICPWTLIKGTDLYRGDHEPKTEEILQ